MPPPVPPSDGRAGGSALEHPAKIGASSAEHIKHRVSIPARDVQAKILRCLCEVAEGCRSPCGGGIDAPGSLLAFFP